MTKVELHYSVTRPLEDAHLNAIAKITSVYGMQSVKLAPSLQELAVTYDASRLEIKDVDAVLHRFGLPVERQAT